MSILGNLNEILEDEQNEGAYTTPAVIRDNKNYISFKKACIMSTILHPAVVAVIALVSFGLMLLGIDLFMLKPPKPKMNDLEFVLVEKQAPPINKKTPYRADINSRAGGKHDPKRKVSMPSPKPAKTQKPKQAAPAAKAQKKVTKPAAPKATQQAPKKASPQPAKTNVAPKPAPPSVKPSTKPVAAPKVTTNPKTNFTVPVPPSANKGSLSTGPVGSTGTSNKSAGGNYAPTPSLAPTYKSNGTGTGSGTSTGSKGATGSKGGTGNYGNPGPGNPNGAPGIDTIAAPDFGPYMRDLQRRIKMNWDPPKGNESKRVVLLFKIAKDGRLLSCTVHKSSGLPAADKAAINAVHLTAPFKPLPANFRGSSVDIQFTFDYNVFGGSYR
ncbi:TonB family protein [bacterium]|nr:TonB family protein [bacterium]